MIVIIFNGLVVISGRVVLNQSSILYTSEPILNIGGVIVGLIFECGDRREDKIKRLLGVDVDC